MITKNENLKIDWEIEERFEKVDYHVQEVSLIGFDDIGNKYTAFAVESCGDIEDISEIELLKN